jgi:aryl-alcohol dehydrogenase-like predicted oxidoreductase
VLLGARSVEQLEGTLAAADLDLSEDVRARIAALTPEPPPATDRSEERSPR